MSLLGQRSFTIPGSYPIIGILFHVVVLVVLGGKASLSEPDVIEGVCSWNVSSTPKVVPASIFPVRFSACWRGKLLWRRPYGGVQITFDSAVPKTTQGTYRVCLTAKDYGTNIFTRTRNTLKTLRCYDDANTTSEICASSDTKEILVHFEATDLLKTETAMFTYRTSFKKKGSGSLRAKECKPCGQRELIKSFCAGDFAVRGYVRSVLPISDGRERGEAVVVTMNVFHQVAKIFEKSPNGREIIGNVNFPLHCHWRKRVRHGYLFTGNLRTGDGPIIHCRIKFRRWRKLYRKNICDNIAVET